MTTVPIQQRINFNPRDWEFNGVDFLSSSNLSTATQLAYTWTISVWVKKREMGVNVDYNDEEVIYNGDTVTYGQAAQYIFDSGNFYLRINGDSTLTLFAKNTGGGTMLNVTSDVALSDYEWHHIYITISSQTGVGFHHLFVDGIKYNLTGTHLNNQINFQGDELYIGSSIEKNLKFNGFIKELWLGFGIYNEDRGVENFYLNGKTRYLGEWGQLPFNKQPAFYLSGQRGIHDFRNNRGYLRDFSIIQQSSESGISGSLFESQSDLPGGVLSGGELPIEGTLLGTTNALNHGAITYFMEGSLFQDADTLNHGLITHLIEGSLLSDADTLNHGVIDPLTIAGPDFTDADVFAGGELSGNAGVEPSVLFQDADTFYGGLVEPTNIFDSKFLEDADTFYGGELVLNLDQIFGTFLDSEEQVYHGTIEHGLASTFLQNVNVLYHGLITYFIDSSFLQNTSNLYHGLFNPDIGGSLLEDDDNFFNNNAEQNIIRGSLFTDDDIINDNGVNRKLIGTILQDADILYHGIILGSPVGSLLEDADIFFHGMVDSGSVFGDLLVDPDIFYGGSLIPPPITNYRLLLNNLISSGADIVDLADEITLQEQRATAAGTEHLGIFIDEDTV